MSAYPGQCRDCRRRRDVFSIQRKGAGAYNRGQRWYSSSMCGECAVAGLAYASPGVQTSSSWSVLGLERIVASLGTVEAAEVLTAFWEKEDRRKWARNPTA